MRNDPLRKAHCRSCYGKCGHMRGNREIHSQRTYAQSCGRKQALEISSAGWPLAHRWMAAGWLLNGWMLDVWLTGSTSDQNESPKEKLVQMHDLYTDWG